MCAVLTAHLSGGANTAPPGLRLDFGEGRGRGKGREMEGKQRKVEGERKGEGGEERERRKIKREGGRRKKGKEREERRGREEFCAVVIFSWENPCAILRGWLCRCGCKPTSRCNKSRDCLRR